MTGLGEVDFARGARPYITAVDVFHSAPVSTGDAFFEFRFSRFANAPGQWIDVTGDRAALARCPISLSVRNGDNRAHYGFKEDPSKPLRRLPDIDSGLTSDGVEIAGDRARCRFSARHDPWAQLVDLLRFFGQRRFRIETWVVLRLSGTGACMAPRPVEDTTLEIEVLSTRSGVYRVAYAAQGLPGWSGVFLGAEMAEMPAALVTT